ncbi:hypothetical protein DFH07DRAFT_784915 [Mycena maculata]|uniref:Uncharacterized protein n=1 Tax=Mycena maculata TaxID=230809 RepID=A0AAD7HEN4_9AGAR|nr:hypothetical protein DFH07DRAFT_784915 [Mycena maculata]
MAATRDPRDHGKRSMVPSANVKGNYLRPCSHEGQCDKKTGGPNIRKVGQGECADMVELADGLDNGAREGETGIEMPDQTSGHSSLGTPSRMASSIDKRSMLEVAEYKWNPEFKDGHKIDEPGLPVSRLGMDYCTVLNAHHVPTQTEGVYIDRRQRKPSVEIMSIQADSSGGLLDHAPQQRPEATTVARSGRHTRHFRQRTI